MKTKLLNNKLSLKKETISNLENKQMDNVRGGVPTSWIRPCLTINDTYCVQTACDPTCCTSDMACSC